MADLRHDRATGRWVAIAPGRARRPGASKPASDELADCPFCAGHEDMTPPETLRLGDGPTGWGVRVVPNLYPALERQEVVIHGPAHVHSIGELADATLDLVAEAWQRRARDAGGTCFPILNEGHDAGASLPHSHSQLAWLPAAPPTVLAEHGLLADVVRRLHRVRGEALVPLNAWLHESPHWHLELMPRTTRLASLELGAGVYINPVAPEQAAAELGAASS